MADPTKCIHEEYINKKEITNFMHKKTLLVISLAQIPKKKKKKHRLRNEKLRNFVVFQNKNNRDAKEK